MIKDKERYFINNYWHYYQELENEFLQARKYVEFSENNFNTYSIELLKLYQAACSEIDVVGKILAAEVNKDYKVEDKSSIYKWWFEIQDRCVLVEGEKNYPLIENEVKLLDMICIKPWASFKVEKYFDKRNNIRYRCLEKYKIPTWWSDYNKVKHQRISLSKDDKLKINYTKANLQNTAYSFSALYILLIAYAEVLNIRDRLTNSKLFEVLKPIPVEEIKSLFRVA